MKSKVFSSFLAVLTLVVFLSSSLFAQEQTPSAKHQNNKKIETIKKTTENKKEEKPIIEAKKDTAKHTKSTKVKHLNLHKKQETKSKETK